MNPAILRFPLLVALVLPAFTVRGSPRITPTVKIVQRVESGVVAIFSQDPDGKLNSGSGSIIHEDGFILTNDHVVRDWRGWVLIKGCKPLPYQTVGRLPEKDLAVIRVKAPGPMNPIPLGRSHDLMTGEPILVGGNPGGRGIVFSSGIVSSPAFMVDIPNALVMTKFEGDVRDRFIQFDAASNAGNSGGPVINAEGRIIGVVQGKNYEMENINYAIPIDRMRSLLPRMIAPEARAGFHLGMDVDPLADRAVVRQVDKDSPADEAGLKAGDVLTELDGKPLRNGIDWLLELVSKKPGDTPRAALERFGKSRSLEIALGAYPAVKAADAEGKKPGLRYTLYKGSWKKMPDFTELKALKTGEAETLDPNKMASGLNENYALALVGYMDIPETGLYRVILASDDGSRFILNDQLFIDNDGPHPRREMSRLERFEKGLHPVRLEYFETVGDKILELILIREDVEDKPASPARFFHD